MLHPVPFDNFVVFSDKKTDNGNRARNVCGKHEINISAYPVSFKTKFRLLSILHEKSQW